ncbi:serine protein kinase RIO [Candidatus Micrarchaeota archaeon]|nr:serine protein kinase RIO [Candidatus Micrarchaeota archaeon]
MTKKPDKYVKQLKERQKIESDVFDRHALFAISKIMKKGIIDNMDYPVSTGKESIVFKATTASGSIVALKIYKIETSPFLKKLDYMYGDPRFEKIKKSEKEIVLAFTRKEFRNLELCEKAGVHAPKPLFIQDNVLVMQFLGEEGLPYPTLGQTVCEERFLQPILDDIRRMYKAGLVHADLSEYNIMVANDGTPYLIDFGQGVVLAHPKAEEYLERDVRNVLKFFSKFGFKRDEEKELKKIRK